VALLVQDLFTDTNGVHLESHTPNLDQGTGWVNFGNASGGSTAGSLQIQGNAATTQAVVTGYPVYGIDCGVADMVLTVLMAIANQTSYLAWCAIRITDVTHWFAVMIERDSGGTAYFGIYEYDGSIHLRDSNNFSVDPTNTIVTVTVTTSGTSISATAEIAASVVATASYSSSNNLTATSHGLLGYEDLAYGRCAYDNFEIDGGSAPPTGQPMMRRWGGRGPVPGIGQSSGGGKAWGRTRTGLLVPSWIPS